jgi:MFS family permease
MYIMSCWYKRSEFALRTGIFFAGATISGAFGGLIAARIGSHFQHVAGHPAWSWIFIIEGLITVAAGLASFWIIQDFPDTAKFLTPEERARVVERLREDLQHSVTGEGLRMKTIVEAITSPRTYLSMVLYAGCTMPIYAFSLFMPSIIAALGYTSTTANLMTVPVYAVACTTTVIGAWTSDRLQKRGMFNIVCLSIGRPYLPHILRRPFNCRPQPSLRI